MDIKTISGKIEHESMQGAIHQFMGEVIIHTQGTEKAQFVGVEHAPIQCGKVVFHFVCGDAIRLKTRSCGF